MRIGYVMGNLWCTRKEDSLTGLKLMQVRVLNDLDDCSADYSVVVAVDMIGAGIGEKVLLASGSSARKHAQLEEAPIDMLIVGIIDPDNDSSSDQAAGV
ncbi:MAG: EutN/CcmL family microcompartment protein [Coriobacteriales bacterium]|jgi:ethanolamine utilization protein EutN|nr:EutN/CcmL family microcompartment protein [Coriobacteriales bacterium]